MASSGGPTTPGSKQSMQAQGKTSLRSEERVYDALNVLMAMNIISKEKKEIRWVGLPTSSVQECKKLDDEKTRRLERIRQKTEQLQDLIVQVNHRIQWHLIRASLSRTDYLFSIGGVQEFGRAKQAVGTRQRETIAEINALPAVYRHPYGQAYSRGLLQS